MTDTDHAIRLRDVSKHYLLFARPEDRLKQMIVPRLQRLVGREPARYYRDFAALSGISFDIRRGETVGIVGRNGSGKSTLLQVICGTLRPSTGTVEVNGRIAALLELGSGFNPEFTGRENIYINGAILGLTRDEVDTRFDSIARFADIGEFIDQPVKTYSSGMYVRLAFATATNVDPDILVVDEALAVGDEAFQRKCFSRLEDIKDRGGTILFVSHSMQSVVQLCSRAILIDRGEVLIEGRPKLVTTHYQRLVNASAEATIAIRDSIRELARAATTPILPSTAGAEVVAASETGPPPAFVESNSPETVAPLSDEAFVADYFDPNLKSQSTVYMEERGARIHDVRLTTLHGKSVNVLRMGKRYIINFAVTAETADDNIGFELVLKSKSGLVLAGADTFRSRALRARLASTPATFAVQFEFTCKLMPGTYFISCGVSGARNGERIWLHKIVEGTAFRVAHEEEAINFGWTNLDISPQIRMM